MCEGVWECWGLNPKQWRPPPKRGNKAYHVHFFVSSRPFFDADLVSFDPALYLKGMQNFRQPWSVHAEFPSNMECAWQILRFAHLWNRLQCHCSQPAGKHITYLHMQLFSWRNEITWTQQCASTDVDRDAHIKERQTCSAFIFLVLFSFLELRRFIFQIQNRTLLRFFCAPIFRYKALE